MIDITLSGNLWLLVSFFTQYSGEPDASGRVIVITFCPSSVRLSFHTHERVVLVAKNYNVWKISMCLDVFGLINICMGKMLRISNGFSSEAAGPMLLKSHVEPPLGGRGVGGAGEG